MKRPLALLLALAPLTAIADEKLVVPATQYPWSAVGRVNYGHGWCSGVLLGPKLAVTAAHCLWSHASRRQMLPEALRFVAGWDRGDFLDASVVVGYQIAPGWRFADMEHYNAAAAANDWALLELERPVGDQVGWVGLGEGPAANMRVVAIGYGQDRKHVPTADIGCHLLSKRADGGWMHDCAALHGDSGGPVLVWKDGGPLLIGIGVAAFGMSDGRTLGSAVAVTDFKAAALAKGASRSGRPGPLAQPADPAMVGKLTGE